jgi:hypothetical protein
MTNNRDGTKIRSRRKPNAIPALRVSPSDPVTGLTSRLSASTRAFFSITHTDTHERFRVHQERTIKRSANASPSYSTRIRKPTHHQPNFCSYNKVKRKLNLRFWQLARAKARQIDPKPRHQILIVNKYVLPTVFFVSVCLFLMGPGYLAALTHRIDVAWKQC